MKGDVGNQRGLQLFIPYLGESGGWGDARRLA